MSEHLPTTSNLVHHMNFLPHYATVYAACKKPEELEVVFSKTTTPNSYGVATKRNVKEGLGS